MYSVVNSSRPLLEAVLRQAWQLRAVLRDDLARQHFLSDDLRMEQYNDIAGTLNTMFNGDAELGSWVRMPDGNIKARGFAIAPDLVTSRTLARLERLTSSLEVILGETEAPNEKLGQLDPSTLSAMEQREVESVAALRGSGSAKSYPELRGFDFVESVELRRVLEADFVEAQLAFGAGAFKASAILAASVVEGVLLDRLMAQANTSDHDWHAATKTLPRRAEQVLWERASLTDLLGAAQRLGLITDTLGAFISGAKDVRDTVHPRREVANRWRAGEDLAQILLSLARALHTRFSELPEETD